MYSSDRFSLKDSLDWVFRSLAIGCKILPAFLVNCFTLGHAITLGVYNKVSYAQCYRVEYLNVAALSHDDTWRCNATNNHR